jgi:uncharacterized membrane protein YkoI
LQKPAERTLIGPFSFRSAGGDYRPPMIDRRKFLAALLGAGALLATTGAAAPDAGARNAVLPLSRIMPSVRRTVPGRIMSAELRGDTYYIRVLTRGGRVVEVRADGHTGAVTGVEGR